MIGNITWDDMDSNLLKVFVTVANSGSLSAAGKELNCVQSNVTARIKQLEDNIGWSLFHRKSRGVTLTEAGERLYGFAADIVRKIDEAEQSMRYLKHAGRLRIGSTESNAAVRLTPLLARLHRKYPEIEFQLLTGTTSHVMKLLLDYKVDLAFVSGHPGHPDVKILHQYEETMVIVEAAVGQVPDVIIGFQKGCTYKEFMEEFMRQQGKADLRTMEFGSLETILGCVEAGMGRAILPLKVVEKFGNRDALKIIRLKKEQENIPTVMACRTDAVPPIAKDLFDL